MKNIAYLSCGGGYSYFKYKNRTLKFRISDRVLKLLSVKEWDPEYGYLVVDVLHDNRGAVEDYIDLLPMLDNLYIDAGNFLKDIKRVEVEYA